MTGMKIGIQLYSLRKFLQKPENVRGVFEKVRDMGADVVQVSGMAPMDSRELARISRDTELPICITHAPFSRLQTDLPRLAEEHLDFGCRHTGIGSMPKEYRGSEDGVRRFVDFLNETAGKLKEFGMTISYHNHDFEFRRVGGRLIMDILIEDTVPEVLFIPDTCWIHAGGQKYVDYAAKMSGRMNTVHLKDYRRRFFRHLPAAIGTGVLDFPPMLAASEIHGAQNAVIELDFSRDPFRDMEAGLKIIREMYQALQSDQSANE